MTLEQQAQALKTRAETAQRNRLTAEAQRDSVSQQLQMAAQRLREEFPEVDSFEAGQRLLAQLQAEAEAELSKVAQALTAAGG